MKTKILSLILCFTMMIPMFLYASCSNSTVNSGGTTTGSESVSTTETETVSTDAAVSEPTWKSVTAEYSEKFLYNTLEERTSSNHDGKGNPAILISGENGYFKYGFTGNGIRIYLANIAENCCNRVKIYIDGVEVETLDLVKTNEVETFTMNKGLEYGEHTIKVVNDVPSKSGTWETWIYSVSVKTSSDDPTVILDANVNSDKYYAPDMPQAKVLEFTETDKTEFSLDSLSTHIGLKIAGDNVYLTDMCNPTTGYHWLAEEIKISLPSEVTEYPGGRSDSVELSWKITSVAESKDAENGYTLKVTYENDSPRMVLEDIWSVAVEDGPVQHTMYIYNRTNKDYTIYSQQSLDIDVKAELSPVAWRFHKENFTADSVGTYRDLITDGKTITALSTNMVDTSNSSGFVPCIFFDASDIQGFYVCWEWPHGRVTATRTGNTINVQAGVINDFKTKIEKNNQYIVPTAYIGTYTGDLDDGTNIMKNWFINVKAPEKLLEDDNEPQTQVGAYLSPVLHDFREMGIRSMKFDYGWWADNNEGIWVANENDILNRLKTYGCNSMSEYGKMLQEKGIGFTLYVLLHDAKVAGTDILTSVGASGHPEWFTDRKASSSESADLGDTSCVAFLKNKLYRLFTENYVTTWRTDMEAMPWSSLYDNRHVYGNIDTTYWVATGFYEILDYLYSVIPGFRYENCGSGGAYKDFATMSRSLVVQLEDRASISNNRRTFYTSSYMYSPLQLGCVVSPDMFNPNIKDSYTGYDFDFGLRSCIMCVPMICVWKGASDGHYLYGFEEKVSEYFNMYCDKIVPIQKGGNTYHILPRPDDIHWDGMEFYNSESGDGVVFLFKPTNTEGSIKNIRFDGLENDAVYELVFQDNESANCLLTGEELMKNGIDVVIEGDFGSEIIWFSRK